MLVLKKGQVKIDEFAFVLLAGMVLIFILMLAWGTPSEAVPVVEPTSISRSIPRKSSASFDIKIIGKATGVNLTTTGQIEGWITFSKNYFDVVDSTTVTVKVKVPYVSLKTYTGNIVVESLGGKKSIPVSITVTEYEVEEFSRAISLGDFSVAYTIGSDTLNSKKDFEVAKGYFSDSSKSLIGTLEQDKLDIVTDGYVQIVVEETNSAGNLIIHFNDEEVFSQKVAAGVYDIPIEKSLIKTSNTVRISADTPGWMFWMSTVYKIKSAKIVVDYKGIFSKEIYFSLDQNEADNFANFHLSYWVPDDGYELPLPELLIEINNQLIYSDRPPLKFFNRTFEKDIMGNDIFVTSGNNTISFSFEEEASYEIRGALLKIYYHA